MLTLSGESGQTAIERNSVCDIPRLPVPQVHMAEGARERGSNNVIWESAAARSQLQRYELNTWNVNLSMCGHGAFW